MKRCAASILLCSLAAGTFAEARPCPVPSSGSAQLGTIDAGERLSFIRRRVASGAAWTRHWRGSWTGVWGAATVGQLASIPLDSDPGVRTDNAVGAAFTATTVAALWLLDPAVLTEERRLDALGAPDDEHICAALAVAERSLEAAARDQAISTGPLMHLVNLGVGAAYVLVLGLGYERWESGLVGGGVGFALGEAMIFSQPQRLEGDLAAYRAGNLERNGSASAGLRHIAVGPVTARGQLGVGLGFAF